MTTLVIMPAYVAASNAFWGDKFPAEETYGDFAKFNDAFHILVAKLPRIVTAGARESWERVTDAFETYIKDIRKVGGYTEMIEATLEMGTRAGWVSAAFTFVMARHSWTCPPERSCSRRDARFRYVGHAGECNLGGLLVPCLPASTSLGLQARRS